MEWIFSESSILMLFCLAGLLFRLVQSVLSRKNKIDKAGIKAFVSNGKNWVRLILSLGSIAILFNLKEDISGFIGSPVEKGGASVKLVCIAIGYFNYAIIKSFLSIVSNAIKPKQA